MVSRWTPVMSEALQPGSTIGILGGGQLGRMLALAAARLGLKCHIFDPASDAPAAQVSDAHTIAAYDDITALTAFAKAVDVVTYEFENIPETALDAIEAIAPVRPNRRTLAVSQDRIAEKEFLQSLGIPVAPFAQVDDLAGLHAALGSVAPPAILKTRRFGYDGKGQVRIREGAQAKDAMRDIADAPAVLEAMIPFEREVSVIAARGVKGPIAVFDIGENVHRDGILHSTTVPAEISAKQSGEAILIAGKILNALDYIGVMGIEFFVTADAMLVNEIAPRVHNSGHWTQAGCVVDQFEQHIRAVAGWPLGEPMRHADVEMINLIGDDAHGWADVTTAGLHLYGKAEARPGRKMGHINRIITKA